MVRQAFTLIELMITVVIMVVIIGVVVGLYAFTAERAAHAVATTSTIDQARGVSETLDRTIRDAVSCSTVVTTGGTALKCVMPANSVDQDGDAIEDYYTPASISPRGIERWGTGKRIWFYMADSSGNINNAGNYVWRAERSDDSNPGFGDRSAHWDYYYDSTNPRFYLIDSMTFTVDSNLHTVAYTVQASALTRADRRSPNATTSDAAVSRVSAVSKTVFWQHWRK